MKEMRVLPPLRQWEDDPTLVTNNQMLGQIEYQMQAIENWVMKLETK